jgi:hypothetical protein
MYIHRLMERFVKYVVEMCSGPMFHKNSKVDRGQTQDTQSISPIHGTSFIRNISRIPQSPLE